MSITKLSWQWQSSNSNPGIASTQTPSTPNPQTGRVITGMLTGGHTDLFCAPLRSTGGSNRNDHGF